MNQTQTIETLVEALEAARNHLDYCGYGDSWERECAEGLSDKIENALEAGYIFAPSEEYLEKKKKEEELKKIVEAHTCQFCGKIVGGSLKGHRKYNKSCRSLRGLLNE